MIGATRSAISLAYIVRRAYPLPGARPTITRLGAHAAAHAVAAHRHGRHEGGGARRRGPAVRQHGRHRRWWPRAWHRAPIVRGPATSIILSGPIRLHGVAIMSVREGLEFEVEIESDTQPLGALVAALVAASPTSTCSATRPAAGSPRRSTRSPSPRASASPSTSRRCPSRKRCAAPARCWSRSVPRRQRGGVAWRSCRPRAPRRRCSRCGSLPEGAEAAVHRGRSRPITPGMVTVRTIVGSERIVDMLVGEQLPRIC